MKQLKKYTPLLLNKKTFLAILAVLFLVVSVVAFRHAFFIAVLLVLTVFSKLPEIIWRTINVDLTMFNLIVLGSVYGWPFGIFIALTGFYIALVIKTGIAKHVAPEKFQS